MKLTARNLFTAFCCTGLIAAAGCSNAGELSVTGMYGSQGQALSGDRCDEFLLDAADADTAEGEAEMKERYRECVENALDEDGRDGQCRDHDDATCDIILDEIGDALHRIREANGDGEAPDCSNPDAGGQEALCHLMAAYEACELDRDNDGDPDVGDRPDGEGDGGESTDDQDPNRPDEEGNPDGEPADGGECEELRERASQVGEGDSEAIRNEHPDCFEGNEPGPDGEATEPPAENPDGENGQPPAEGGADAFCEELREEIERTDNEERRNELHETYDRECPL